MKIIAIVAVIFGSFILYCYPLNIAIDMIAFLSVHFGIVYVCLNRCFNSKAQKDGSTFAFFPVKASYTTDENGFTSKKYVWLCKVHFQYFDNRRNYHTTGIRK